MFKMLRNPNPPPALDIGPVGRPPSTFFLFLKKSLRAALGSGTTALGELRKKNYGSFSVEGISKVDISPNCRF